ncbi:MAG TPA: class I SAM-dependent methyltransferase [Methylomirabilota bacterium]|nr:class I SAM-dependent methyltransferase [Methylomirabilota bacterium]
MSRAQVSGSSRSAEFDRLAPLYDALVSVMAFFIGGEHRLRQRVVALVDPRPGERVLDVACGTGTLAALMAERVGTGGSVVGIDFSPRLIELARRKEGMPQLSFRQANAEAIPYPEESFDKATITYGLHEMFRPGREKTLNEIRRVLRPGGRLVAVDIYEPRGWARRALFRLWMLLEGPTARDLLASDLSKEIRAAGFEDLHQVFVVRDFIPVTLATKKKSERVSGKEHP